MFELLIVFFISFMVLAMIIGCMEFCDFVLNKTNSIFIAITLSFFIIPIAPLIFFLYVVKDVVKFIKTKIRLERK